MGSLVYTAVTILAGYYFSEAIGLATDISQ